MFCNCLVQSRTYAPTGNRDLEIAPTLRSGISIARYKCTFETGSKSVSVMWGYSSFFKPFYNRFCEIC